MNLNYALQLLWKKKWIILPAFLLSALITFALLSLKPKSYRSETLIATGMMGEGPSLNTQSNNSFVQSDLIKMNFSSLSEQLLKNSTFRLLQYKLLLHDFESNPYRTLPEELSPAVVANLKPVLAARLDSLNGYPLDAELEPHFNKITEDLGYDRKSILEDMAVFRKGETDYIAVSYSSENAGLSSFVVNTMADIFLEKNRSEQERHYRKEYEFAMEQEKEKREEWLSKKEEMAQYRAENSVLDEGSQSESIVSSITELEMSRTKYVQKIPSARKAINRIDQYLNESKSSKVSTKAKSIVQTDDIQRLRKEIAELREAALFEGDLEANKKAAAKTDELEKLMSKFAETEADESKGEGMAQEDLMEQRMRHEIDLINAEEMVASIDKTLNKYKGKQHSLVKDVASVSKMSSELALANVQFEDAREKLQKAKEQLEKAYQPLSIIEKGIPANKPERTHKGLFSLMAGLLGGLIAAFGILMTGFAKRIITDANVFTPLTQIPLLASVQELKTDVKDFDAFYHSEARSKNEEKFKNDVRDLRFQIENSGSKIFLFTSGKGQVGKSFLLMNLASIFKLKRKRVLLIDTNFKNNFLSRLISQGEETKLLTTTLEDTQLSTSFEVGSTNHSTGLVRDIDIIGNKGGVLTPGEVLEGAHFEEFLEGMSQQYDYIFFESAGMNDYADAKELIEMVEKVIVVYAAGESLADKDFETISFLKNLHGKLLGGVLNRLQK